MSMPVPSPRHTLSRKAAQAFILAVQGVDGPQALPNLPRPATKADVREVIGRMGVLQIDTIHVVARSPYLVLWSRLGHYDPKWLDELLAEAALFEYWSHEASMLPIEDYPLYRRLQLDHRRGWRNVEAWNAANPGVAERVLAAVREQGPVRSSDFKRTDGETGNWWNWKPEKVALEHLHSGGDLMTARRHNFQRIYDLRERVLPWWDDADTPSLETAQIALCDKSWRCLGLALPQWIIDYFRLPKHTDVKRLNERVMARMVDEGRLLPVAVEGWESVAYVHADHAELLAAVAAGELQATRTVLLSPFDPIVWDRARAKAVWDFDYRIECYTPAPKRQYGYFTLPILHRGRLVGRLDPKAHRSTGVFEVRALHFEPGVDVTPELVADLRGVLREVAEWHGTPEVVVRGEGIDGLTDGG